MGAVSGEAREAGFLLVVFVVALVLGSLIGAHFEQTRDCDFFFDGMRYFVEYSNETLGQEIVDVMKQSDFYGRLGWNYTEFNQSDFNEKLKERVT